MSFPAAECCSTRLHKTIEPSRRSTTNNCLARSLRSRRATPSFCIRASSSTNDGFGKQFSQAASNAFDAAQKRAKDFEQEHNVSKKASSFGQRAAKTIKQKYDEVEDEVRRTARSMDLNYSIRDKTSKAFEQMKGSAETVDKRFGIRKKIQILMADLRRNWPDIKRRASDFFSSPIGKVTTFTLLYLALISGLLFKILTWGLLLIWAAVIFGLPRRLVLWAAEQQQKQQEQQYGGQGFGGGPYGQGQGPYADPYQQWGRSRGQAQAARGKANTGSRDSTGSVIDVEWTTLDEGDKRK